MSSVFYSTLRRLSAGKKRNVQHNSTSASVRSFLQKFTVPENSLCMLFANDARRQLHNIFIQFGDNIQTTRQLRSAVFAKFFDKS